MAYKIDPTTDREWVDEFRKRPVGPHSPNLQRVLNTLRDGPLARALRADLHQAVPRMGARAPSGRARQAVRDPGPAPLRGLDEAEWTVFRLRWKEHTGQDLN